ncbi:phosphatase PAP2 family protein [Alkalihalobacillus pseudalcaliphilus]|uniref:phosphatase PAP2 family protein n=1 Tax=Alkalihalobacillus pseudalcaliphilus TaxID=79884 RepID=UPI00069DFECE|nr:phosphatase PAP2 family protein [Alkalihalobacillus pseudalcaliphilus]
MDNLLFKLTLSLENSFTNELFVLITELGSKTFLIVGTIVLSIVFLLLKKRQDALVLGCLMIGGSCLNLLLKAVFSRERPEVIMMYDGFGYSYPSNHSMMSFLLYGFLIYFIGKHFHKNSVTILIQILIALLIVLIGFSRIYLGVHYASDVWGGFALAAMMLIMADVVREHFNRRNIH